MKAGPVDPSRWKETSFDAHALSARAADLVDSVRDVPPLAPEAIARIRAGALARGRAGRGRGLRLAVRFAVLAIALLASVATAKATMTLWRRHVAAVAAAKARVDRVAHARPAPRRPAEAVVVAPPRAPVVRPSAVHPRRVAVAAPAREAAPPAETEAQLLARVLSRLRQAHDAPGAVALLDEYARTFPHGVLAAEAATARLEAAIQLDDRRTALRLLDARSAFAGRLGEQQLLTRAELRASAGRYGDALGDFDRLLGAQAAALPADLERALYGRAVCLGHLGRDDRARADLDAYQRRFPDGKHAAEVARLLAGAHPERRP